MGKQDRFDSYMIDRFDLDSGVMQGVNDDGVRREFILVADVDRLTATEDSLKIEVNWARHYTDPTMKPRWEDSTPWGEKGE